MSSPRDSFYDERIVWTGRPKICGPSSMQRSLSWASFALALVSASFGLVIWLALDVTPFRPLLFSVWMTLVGVGLLEFPKWWLSKVRYEVTDNHVIWRRGPFRRTIERRAISFARVFWLPGQPGVGDLELVRAVPTGALRRRLMLRLGGVSAPDRVWAIVRGVETTVPAGLGERPLTQRLDSGERVRWTASPRSSWRDFLPRGRRALSLLVLGLLMWGMTLHMLLRAVPITTQLAEAGLGGTPLVALILAQAVAIGLVLTLACLLVYHASIRPGRLLGRTRYLVTDRRVLIQRGSEELHLDKGRIVDVVNSPSSQGLCDLFLVLDGPRARALAMSGAFGELDGGPQLRPVLRAISDVEGASKALKEDYAQAA